MAKKERNRAKGSKKRFTKAIKGKPRENRIRIEEWKEGIIDDSLKEKVRKQDWDDLGMWK